MRPASFTPCALAAVLALPAWSRQAGEERLEEARTLFASSKEQDVRSAGNICVEVDTPAAVELLLDVLDETSQTRGLPPAHYRDVVWEALIRINDHYARLRIEEELRKNKKNAEVRQWCAELLGIYGEYELGETLAKALSDREPGVQRAATRSLGMLGYREAEKKLLKLARNKDPYLRADALEALARIDVQANGAALAAAVADDPDGGVRCALLADAVELLPDDVEVLSTAALGDEDWRPRIQAVQNLAGVRTKSSVDQLVAATGDARPVVALEAVHALQELTGQLHTRQEAWTEWWQANRETFDFPDGRKVERKALDEERSVAVYNGIHLVSDHVAFLIDKSAAMQKPLKDRGCSKEEAAQEELEQLLSQLHGRLTFNVFTYEREVVAFEKKPVELNDRTQKKALEFVADQRLQDKKDIWQVLETVIDDPTLDTVVLLSSGEPDIGLYVHWNRVTRYLRDLNRFHKVVVHTVAYSDNQGYRSQLERIAEATGGEFRWFE